MKKTHEEIVNENKEFESLARPLIKYLCENYHPHAMIIITPTKAELVEGIKSTKEIADYILD